jgi:hypothetical protein
MQWRDGALAMVSIDGRSNWLKRRLTSFSFPLMFSAVLLDSSILCVHAFGQPSITSCQRSTKRLQPQRQLACSNLFEANGNNNDPSGDDQLHQQGLGALPGPEDTNEENIRSLFALFNNALATYVVHCYMTKHFLACMHLLLTNCFVVHLFFLFVEVEYPKLSPNGMPKTPSCCQVPMAIPS